MKILVTGGKGYLASHFIEVAHKLGRETVAVDKDDNWEELANGCDSCVHFAAFCDTQSQDAERFFHDGTALTFRALEIARKLKFRKFVFASSGAVYGDLYGDIGRSNYTQLKPISAYGASKVAGEAMVNAYQEQYGIPGVCLRFCAVVGPRQPRGVLYDFIQKLKKDKDHLEILGDGEQRRQYLYTQDAALVTLQAVLAADIFGPYNVAGRGMISPLQIAHIVAQTMNCMPQLTFTGGTQGWKGDTATFEMHSDLNSFSWAKAYIGWARPDSKFKNFMTSYEALVTAAEELCKQ